MKYHCCLRLMIACLCMFVLCGWAEAAQVSPEDAAAMVDGVYYATVQEAVVAWHDGDAGSTLTLFDDYTVKEPIQISGKKLTD